MLKYRYIHALAAVAVAFSTSASYSDVVILDASKDNTLYEQINGSLSNGAGDYIFAGRTAIGGIIRRGLIAFDIAGSVPKGAIINSVSLDLHMSTTIVGPQATSLHRTFIDWGEGASDAPGGEGAGAPAQPDDATWLHTFFAKDFWTAVGGDFDIAASATTMVGGIGFYNWNSTQMISDVQMWLDNPGSDFGWTIVGNEDTFPTAKKFCSRTSPIANPDQRPVLTIDYTLTDPCPWDLDNSGAVGTSDLLELFAQWGTAGPADFDESGAVGTNDLLILFANWGPC